MNTAFSFEEEPFEAYSELDEEQTEFDEEAFDAELAGLEWEEEVRRGRRIPSRPVRLRSGSVRPRRPPIRPSHPLRPPKRPPRPRPRPVVIAREPQVVEYPPQGTEYIRWVQDSLNRILGLQLPVDGIMGPETRSAVRSFQERERLPVTGIVGPDTERALIAAAASQPPQAKEFEAFDTELDDEGLWELGGSKLTAVETPGGGRIKDKTPLNSADLVTVTGVGRKRIQLHRLAAQARQALISAARASGIKEPLLLPTSGYRSPATQERLWRNAFKKYGSAEEARKWVAPPGGSAHQTGRAIDFYLGGKNSSANVKRLRTLPAYKWLAANAERFGFYPYAREPWHWEYNPPSTASGELEEFESFDEYEQAASQCRCDPPKPKPKSKEMEALFDEFAEYTEEVGPLELEEPDFELIEGGIIDKLPPGPFGTLTISQPSQFRFSYVFTPEDVLWTARFVVGEAGGRNNPENQAVIWAMFNRYAFFTHRYYKAFHNFIRAYSTPLQPVLRSWGAAKRHMHKPDFVRTGGFYAPPHNDVPKGQLRNFLKLQQTAWEKLPEGARTLALRAMNGRVPNPIGNASEFGSTRVYFRDRYGRYPSDEEWHRFTQAYARRKRWRWIGPVVGLDQKKNTFFMQTRVANLPSNTVRIIPPERVMDQEADFYERDEQAIFEEATEWFDEYEDDCPECSEVEEEFRLSAIPKPIKDALRNRREKEAIKLALQQGLSKEDITDLVFFWRHPERLDSSGVGRPITRDEPQFQQLKKKWFDIQKGLVEPVIGQVGMVGGPHPEVNTLMPKEGPGFFCRKPDSRRWGLPETIMALTTVAARWFLKYPKGPRIVISDISKHGGGDIDHHKSHEVGLDVDIQLIRNDNKDSVTGITCNDSAYSRARTQELISLILNNGVLAVKTIGFCDKGITLPKLVRWSGHHNHLHVRFYVPAHYKKLRQRIPKQPDYQC